MHVTAKTIESSESHIAFIHLADQKVRAMPIMTFASRLLRDENALLKRLVADLTLEKHIDDGAVNPGSLRELSVSVGGG